MKKITFEGKVYEYTQEAYYNAGTGMYEANVKDDDGRYYKAYFIIDNENAEEEADMCDWDNPIEIEFVGQGN